jgi:RNA polymerase sigma-70 factor (ECF subfamily)
MTNEQNLFWKALEPEYHRAMLFCRKLIGDRDRGDDLFQDALVIACTKFGDLRNPDAFRPWLYRVMISTFQSSVRRPWWKRAKSLTPETESLLVTSDPADSHAARRWLGRAFEAIGADDQALVVLHELEGWSIKELADLQSQSESNIKVRLFRARKKMRQVLEQYRAKSRMDKATDSDESEAKGCVATKYRTE